MVPLMRAVLLTSLAGLLILAGLSSCGAPTGGPAISHVEPSAASPGSLLLVSGGAFHSGDEVWIGGRPTVTTWVNGGLLTTTIPADQPPGPQALEVRSTSGRRTLASVTVSAESPDAKPAAVQPVSAPETAQPPPPMPTVEARQPVPPAAILATATPAPQRPLPVPALGRDQDDESGDRNKDKEKRDKDKRKKDDD